MNAYVLASIKKIWRYSNDDLITVENIFQQILVACDKFTEQDEPVEDGAEEIDKKSFSITDNAFIKIVLMMLKARLRQPIIIMGESGCGKTYLT